jgi:hypothetical protein
MASKHPVLHQPLNAISQFRALQLRYFGEWWMLEILSWGFSAVCVGIIIVFLRYYNGQQIPNLPFGLTISGLVSLFAGIARSSLLLTIAELLGQLKWVSSAVFLFIWISRTRSTPTDHIKNSFHQHSRSLKDFERIDEASRGPWGALVLLTRTKGL